MKDGEKTSRCVSVSGCRAPSPSLRWIDTQLLTPIERGGISCIGEVNDIGRKVTKMALDIQ